MNKKKVILTSLLGVASLGAIATGATIALTSCGSTTKSNVANIQYYDVKFDNQKSRSIDDVDPNFNNDAITKIKKLFEDGGLERIIQGDLNRWIYQFLSAFEHESESTEYELADQEVYGNDVIKISNVKILDNLTITFDAAVKVVKEIETTKDTETVETRLVTGLEMQVELVDWEQLTTNYISKLPAVKNEKAISTDLEDIYELYLGEKDNKIGDDDFDFNNDFDFENDDLYEKGILNYLFNFNAQVSSNAKMLGYQFDATNMIEKIFNARIQNLPTEGKGNTENPLAIKQKGQNVICWAPAVELNTIMVPNFESGVNLNINVETVVNKFSDASTALRTIRDSLEQITTASLLNIEELKKWFKDNLGVTLPDIQSVSSHEITLKQDSNLGSYLVLKLNSMEFKIYQKWWQQNK